MATVNTEVDVNLKKKVIKGSITFPAAIRGLDGKSGVYIGDTEPTDPDVNVWLDPDGEASGVVTSVNGKQGDVELDAEDVGALDKDTPIPVVEFMTDSDIRNIWNSIT